MRPLGNEEDHVPIYVKDNGGKEPVFGVCKDGVITFDRSNGCGEKTAGTTQSAYIVFKGNTETVGAATTDINTNRCVYPSDFQGKCAYDTHQVTKHFKDSIAHEPSSCPYECHCAATHNTCAEGYSPKDSHLDGELSLRTNNDCHSGLFPMSVKYCETGSCGSSVTGPTVHAHPNADEACAALCNLQACSCEKA